VGIAATDVESAGLQNSPTEVAGELTEQAQQREALVQAMAQAAAMRAALDAEEGRVAPPLSGNAHAMK